MERQIGRVVSVDNFRVHIRLDDINSAYKSGMNDIYDVARINSYVVIPVGTDMIIAMITRITMNEESRLENLSSTISLPKSSHYIIATMLGTINKETKYTQGVYNFPVIDNPVWYITKENLDIIFDNKNNDKIDYKNDFYLPIGDSSAFEGHKVKICPDQLFVKHGAILGNTGSGKSCTLTTILQSLFKFSNDNEEPLKSAHFVIFDTNGEYEKGTFDSKQTNLLHVNENALKVPYWFMNWDDFEYLFKPSSGAQKPALRDAIIKDKNSDKGIDAPCWFNYKQIFTSSIESVAPPRTGDYIATLLFRMESFFNDERFANPLMLKDDDFDNSLAIFLAFILGDLFKFDANVSDNPFTKYYNEQNMKESKQNQITVLDMSSLSFEVLESIIGLIARLIIEFVSRFTAEQRGKMPIVLVLEEAQNYIPERSHGDQESIAKKVFERIAREGRKYGVSLIVSSQRPAELSRTVLSQCNSFIVHRLQNPEDQKYIRGLVSVANEDILRQIAILPTRHAIIMGDCVRAPVHAKIEIADPTPNSKNPPFVGSWIKEKRNSPNYIEICKEWQGEKKDEIP